MNIPYTVLVNSSDGFEDCWYPFFRLFSLYWPDNRAPILLNTETKEYSHPGLDIKCTRVQAQNASRQLTWSECLLLALGMIRTPLVLFLLEDFFLERAVNGNLIAEFAGLMKRDEKVKHIGLTHFGSA